MARFLPPRRLSQHGKTRRRGQPIGRVAGLRFELADDQAELALRAAPKHLQRDFRSRLRVRDETRELARLVDLATIEADDDVARFDAGLCGRPAGLRSAPEPDPRCTGGRGSRLSGRLKRRKNSCMSLSASAPPAAWQQRDADLDDRRPGTFDQLGEIGPLRKRRRACQPRQAHERPGHQTTRNTHAATSCVPGRRRSCAASRWERRRPR